MAEIQPKWINGKALAQRWELDFLSLSQISNQFQLQLYRSCSFKDLRNLFDLYDNNRKDELASLLKSKFIGTDDLTEIFHEIDTLLKRTDRKHFSYVVSSELKRYNRSKEMFVKIDHDDYSFVLFTEDQIKSFFMPSRFPNLSANRKKEVLESIFFLFKDIEHFEKEHGKPELQIEPDFDNSKINNHRKEIELIPGNTQRDKLSANDARELGRLRTEKHKWDDSISAAVQIGILCRELSEESQQITRAMLEDKIYIFGYKDLPKTTIEKIWKAIPDQHRKKAGRPSKEKVSNK